jgi:altronate hydrolase
MAASSREFGRKNSFIALLDSICRRCPALLQRTLGGYACHPNFASVLMIGLGFKTNQIPNLLATQGLQRSDRLRAFTIQGTGGTTKTIAAGIAAIDKMLPHANAVLRPRR